MYAPFNDYSHIPAVLKIWTLSLHRIESDQQLRLYWVDLWVDLLIFSKQVPFKVLSPFIRHQHPFSVPISGLGHLLHRILRAFSCACKLYFTFQPVFSILRYHINCYLQFFFYALCILNCCFGSIYSVTYRVVKYWLPMEVWRFTNNAI